MHEQRIVELLTRKIAGEATLEELGELSYLFTKYPDSVYYEALLEQVWELGNNENAIDLDETFHNHKLKYHAELDFELDATLKPVYYKRPVFLYAALCCFVLLISSFFIINYDSPDNEERIEIVAGKGVRKEIKLPDGTVVQLNSDSRISYDMDMQRNATRDINLTGEAFFKVAHDKSKPFIVKTDKVSIKVLGTEFNLKDYPGDAESETTLMKGSVELTINGRTDQKFVLKPSEKLALRRKVEKHSSQRSNSVLVIENIAPVKVGNQEYIEEISWTENKFVFENESFEELLPKLERWYNVQIKLEDPKIQSYKFTGVFINENIIQALEAMQLIKSFNYKLEANEVKIY